MGLLRRPKREAEISLLQVSNQGIGEQARATSFFWGGALVDAQRKLYSEGWALP